MNPQWSDEVKERYIKDQAFLAECTARGIQICTDVSTQKWAVRNKPWFDLTLDELSDCLVEGDPCEALAEPEAWEVMRSVQTKLKEKNT